MENLDIFILNLYVNQFTDTTSLKSLSDCFINLKTFQPFVWSNFFINNYGQANILPIYY